MEKGFSFERFLKVFKCDVKFRLISAIMPLVAVTMALHAGFIFAIIAVNDGCGSFRAMARIVLIELLLLFICYVIPFICYRRINKMENGAGYIMLPATSMEKFISMVLVCSLFVPLCCLLSAVLIDSLFLLIFMDWYDNWIWLGGSLFDCEEVIYFILLSGMGLYGNLSFKRGAWYKTAIIAFVVLVGWAKIGDWIFTKVIFSEDELDFIVNKAFKTTNHVLYTLSGILFYFLAYFKAKRMQIE